MTDGSATDRAIDYWLKRMSTEQLLTYIAPPPLPPLPVGVADSRADSALRIPEHRIDAEIFRRVAMADARGDG